MLTSSDSPGSGPGRLESWKDIAAHFGVNARTVQLWEKERGLPIHRLPGPKGRVYALRHELEAWSAGKPPDVPPAPASASFPHRRLVIWACLLLSLTGALWFIAGRPQPLPLADCRVEGQYLIALDGRNRELWRYELGGPNIPLERTDGHVARATPWVGDLNGDSRPELLFADRPTSISRPDRLLCLSHTGDLLWSIIPGRAVSSGRDSFKPPFRVGDFRVVRLGPGKGLAVILASRHQMEYPLQAALFSPQGRLLREYWHSGQLLQVTVGDADGDGRDEIYLSGISNARKAATLVVLDPLEMQGASLEVDQSYQLQGFPAPRERARILFPVSRPARNLADYALARKTILLQGAAVTMVSEIPWLGDWSSEVQYHFTPSLELSQVGVADNYETSLRRAGRQNQRLTPRDLEDLKKLTWLVRPESRR